MQGLLTPGRTNPRVAAMYAFELRVRGLAGLRVIDSSVFPTEPNGNLNAPTIMLAERASDLVRGRQMLPASEVAVGLAQDWQTSQRTALPERNVRV